MNIAEFGTAKYPLRPSSLKKIVNCSMQSVLELLGESLDTAGAAAETGSVTHAAIEAFHREQRTLDDKIVAGVEALANACKRFPLADQREAEIYFAHYAKDTRNQNAEFIRTHDGRIGLEVKLSGYLDPHPTDPTGQKIVIEGTCDQLRIMFGKLYLCDYKTGKSSAFEMQNMYAYQLAAYMLIARQSGYMVDEVCLIRGYRYRERGADLPNPAEAFVHMPFTYTEVPYILDRVRLEVARIRSGEIQFGPGAMCGWCPMKGLSNCVPKAKKVLKI
jgi:hypothetical protein